MEDLPEKMPWGKYKGIGLWAINSGYLRWLTRQEFILNKPENINLILAVEKELQMRDMDSSHFYKDKVKIK